MVDMMTGMPFWWAGPAPVGSGGSAQAQIDANLAANQAATQSTRGWMLDQFAANQAATAQAQALTANLTQDPAKYAYLGAAYGRNTGGFGGTGNAIPGGYPAGEVTRGDDLLPASSPVTDYGPDYGPLGGGTSTPYGDDYGALPGGYSPQIANILDRYRSGFDPWGENTYGGSHPSIGAKPQPVTSNPVTEGTAQVPQNVTNPWTQGTSPVPYTQPSGQHVPGSWGAYAEMYVPTGINPDTLYQMFQRGQAPDSNILNTPAERQYTPSGGSSSYAKPPQQPGASFNDRYGALPGAGATIPGQADLPIHITNPAGTGSTPRPVVGTPEPPPLPGGDFEWTPGQSSGKHAPGSWGAYAEMYVPSGINPDTLYSMYQQGQTPQSSMMAAGTSPRDQLAEGLARGDRGFAQDVTQQGSNPLPPTLSQNINKDIYNIGNAYGGDQATRDQLAQMMQQMQPSQPQSPGPDFSQRFPYPSSVDLSKANSYGDFASYNRPGVRFGGSGNMFKPQFETYPQLPPPPQSEYPVQTPVGPSFNPYQPTGPASPMQPFPPKGSFGWPTNSFTNDDSGMTAPQPPAQQPPAQQPYPWGTLENKDFSGGFPNQTMANMFGGWQSDPYAVATGA